MKNEEVKFCATRNRGQLKIQLPRNFRFTTCSMPDTGDADDLFIRQNFVDDAVGTKNDFANGFIVLFRHNAAKLRKLSEHIHFGHQAVAERFCDSRIVLSDEQNNGLQIVAGLLRPDYLESHVASCRLTSSCGTVSPRSIWSSPLRMAARNSTRSAMSSRLAFSGKRSIESKANCLSLIPKKITPAVARRKREAEGEQKASETVV